LQIIISILLIVVMKFTLELSFKTIFKIFFLLIFIFTCLFLLFEKLILYYILNFIFYKFFKINWRKYKFKSFSKANFVKWHDLNAANINPIWFIFSMHFIFQVFFGEYFGMYLLSKDVAVWCKFLSDTLIIVFIFSESDEKLLFVVPVLKNWKILRILIFDSFLKTFALVSKTWTRTALIWLKIISWLFQMSWTVKIICIWIILQTVNIIVRMMIVFSICIFWTQVVWLLICFLIIFICILLCC
jgi:hypothetical protein